MNREVLLLTCWLTALASLASAHTGPFDGKTFRGRIAWSCDGNHNDEDDWAASPAALAIFDVFGVKERLVHFDYNNILTNSNPDWEREHEISVLGAIERYGYRRELFHDCRRSLDAAVDSLARAISASSASNPLYLLVAGPVEVLYLAIQKSDPAARRFVYCISHSRWNDGFQRGYYFRYNKRAVIATGVRWVQIADQNRGLATGPFGRPHTEEEWAPWLWMRDSPSEPVRFLWERMRATRRADCSDAGMAYFLMTGDEQTDIAKLRRVIEKRDPPSPLRARPYVRLEAENFPTLQNFELEDHDRDASHRLNVRLAAGARRGRISSSIDEPYTLPRARYNIEVRYRVDAGGECSFALRVNRVRAGTPWRGVSGEGWRSHVLASIAVSSGDTISLETECAPNGSARLDYLQLNLLE